MIRVFLIACVAWISLAGCNKEKINSKRLMKPGNWNVTELSVDGIGEIILPSWEIGDCSIYEEVCIGLWLHPDGESSSFNWQFKNKGKTFVISRQNQPDSCNFITHPVKLQCYNFSGEFEVLERKKKLMQFKSSSTIGFVGKEVIITIEKQ